MSTIPSAEPESGNRRPHSFWGTAALAVAVLVLAMQAAGRVLAAAAGPVTARLGGSTFAAIMTALGSLGVVLALAALVLAGFGISRDSKSKLPAAAAMAIGLAVVVSALFNAIFIPIAAGR